MRPAKIPENRQHFTKGWTSIVTVHGIRIVFYLLSSRNISSRANEIFLLGPFQAFKYAYAISQHHATSADNSRCNLLDDSNAKSLLQLLHGVLWTINRVTDSAGVRKDLIIVAAGEALVAEKVDCLVLNAGNVLLGLDVLQAVSLVPTSGEDIEGDLAADGVAVLQNSGELDTIRGDLAALAQTYVRP